MESSPEGADIKFIQSQLGHASATMTLDRYGHLLPNTLQDVAERLDIQIFGPISATVALLEGSQTGENGGKGRQSELAITGSNNKG